MDLLRGVKSGGKKHSFWFDVDRVLLSQVTTGRPVGGDAYRTLRRSGRDYTYTVTDTGCDTEYDVEDESSDRDKTGSVRTGDCSERTVRV